MSKSALDLIRAALPLAVRGIEVNDPVLSVYGDDWSLTLMCPWKMTGPSDLSVSWESDDIEDRAWDLIGRNIESVTSASADLVDPVFHLQGAVDLAVMADTDLDPWTLQLPGIVVTGMRAE